MKKAVLFDFDGVLTLDETGSQSICNYISKKTGLDCESFKTEYKKYNDGLLREETSHREIWGKLCAGLNKEISIDILYESFENTPVNYEMMEFVEELKRRCYKTGMVTDNQKDRMDFYRQSGKEPRCAKENRDESNLV